MKLQIFHRGAHVFPVPFSHVGARRVALVEETRKDILGKVPVFTLRYAVKDFRIHDVDPGIDSVAEHFTPGWFFHEPFDLVGLIGDHNTEG